MEGVSDLTQSIFLKKRFSISENMHTQKNKLTIHYKALCNLALLPVLVIKLHKLVPFVPFNPLPTPTPLLKDIGHDFQSPILNFVCSLWSP